MKRRILFDLGHPGHFHLFKNTIHYFELHPDFEVFITTRNIPIIISLLNSAGLKYKIIGTRRKGLLGKLFSVLETDIAMLFFVVKNNIDLGLHCGIVLSHVSLLTRMRSWIFDDDDDAVEPLMVNFSHPFSEAVFTPNCIKRKTSRAVYYPGTHELAYLYDGIDSVTDVSDSYSIVRLVAFNGHHDTGHSGLSDEQMTRLVGLLECYGKVIITSEKELSVKWEKYRVAVSANKMHQLMASANIIVGDSQTMISEAATMGVPAFKCNSFAGALAVPNMLEKEFGLCRSYHPNQFDSMLEAIEVVLKLCKDSKKGNDGLKKFKSQKVNTSRLMVYFIEKWELDFDRINQFTEREWLSLGSNIELCPEILLSSSTKNY